VAEFVAELRALNVTPHVGAEHRQPALCDQRSDGPAIPAMRSVSGCASALRRCLGWTKMAAGFRKTRHRGLTRVGWMFMLTATAYNLVRLPKLVGAAA
jgi:hypothetical protein